MKVLWLCNIVLPDIAKELNLSTSVGGGWLKQTSQQLASCDNIEFAVCSPAPKHKGFSTGKTKNLKFLLFRTSDKNIVSVFREFLEDFKPDIIHIFGTEYPHSFHMVKAAEQLNILHKVVISIQGMVSVCASHFLAYMNHKETLHYTLRDFIKHNNIYNQMLEFKRRGKYEIEALKLSKNVIGRTDWDEACTKRINSDINYHFCNETLRKPFYENEWTLENCEKHSIFVSQCSYPIKGFHLMLEAMTDIVKKYPDAKLYTTGKNPLNLSFKQKLRQSYYSKYIGKLIKKYHLENNVEFLGFLDEERMCKQYLNSHVFVCCSSVENSPNSLGEAMILGVPSVSSDVGGVKNLMEHGKEGFVYQADAPYMLSFYIQKIFENDNLALEFSKNARLHASKTHNAQENFDRLMEIYKEVFE